jgi:hypothetical protein
MSSPEPLRFPDPNNPKYWSGLATRNERFLLMPFQEDYESCLVELGLIVEKTFDPVLRSKLESLMAGVKEWLI